MEAVVEILDTHGQCRERHIINNLPAIIGRAYSNQVILSDHFICPQHLEISKSSSGKLQIKDLHSVNGIYLQNKSRKISSADVDVSVELRVGHTLIRIIDPSAPLAATVPFDNPKYWSKRIRITWRHALVSFLLFVVAYHVDTYLLNYRTGENQNFEVLVSAVVGSIIVFLPWAAVWALLGKVNINKPRFYAHFSIPLLVSFFYGIIKRVYSYIEFAFAQPSLLSWFAWIFAFSAIALLFYYHLLYSTKISEKRRWIYSATASILLIGISILVDLKNVFSFSNELPLSYLVKPPWAKVVKSIEVGSFVDMLDEIKDDL